MKLFIWAGVAAIVLVLVMLYMLNVLGMYQEVIDCLSKEWKERAENEPDKSRRDYMLYVAQMIERAAEVEDAIRVDAVAKRELGL